MNNSFEEERDFADVLREIREDKGWSQEELAKRLGTSKQVISRYENRQRTPKISVLSKYATKLNVSLEYMLGIESKNAGLYYTLLRDKKFDKLEDLLEVPRGSIIPLSEEAEAEAHHRVEEARKQQNIYIAQLRLYIDAKLPHLDAHDVELIKGFVDSLASKKK